MQNPKVCHLLRMPLIFSWSNRSAVLVAAPTQTSNDEPLVKKAGFCKSIDWKLMGALIIPVTLETLDYTGELHS